MNASVSVAYIRKPGLTLSTMNANGIHTEILFQLCQISGGGQATLPKVQEQANSPALWRIELGTAPAEVSLAKTITQMRMCVGPGVA